MEIPNDVPSADCCVPLARGDSTTTSPAVKLADYIGLPKASGKADIPASPKTPAAQPAELSKYR